MKLFRKTFLSLVFLGLSILSFGQTFSKQDAEKLVAGSKIVKLHVNDKTVKYIEMDGSRKMFISNPEKWLKTSLKFTKDHGLRVAKKESDKFGYSHVRYQVVYKNLPVEGTVYTIHSKNGNIVSANGEYSLGKDIDIVPQIAEKEAFFKAKNYVHAESYKWGKDDDLRPKGDLVILPNEGTYLLVWKFDIYASEPLSRQYIYINAKTGEVVKSINRIINANTNGTAVTLYSGTVNITTDSYNSSFRLRETNRGNGVETYNLNNGSNYGSATDFIDADNYWDNNSNNDRAANDAHFGAEATYDYYYTHFGRNSFDDNGTKLVSYVHYGNNYVNAFWDGTCMTYGDGDGYTYGPLTPIEVVAHELTHGVTEYTAGLIYSGESGALNESFSDIFGVVVDFEVNPSTANYQMGDAMSPSHTPFRSMSSPNDYNCPDTYLGEYWDPFEEVHTNSGVMNYWFYLLSEGGNGTNDIGNTFHVNGIGRQKAAEIAYRNLSVYLTPSSNHADAREYAIQSAIDIFGECSDEVVAVTNAWYAVGVGNEFDGRIFADFSISHNNVCNLNTVVNFYNKSAKATNYIWYFGDGTTSTDVNPNHTYASAGEYTIKLVASGAAYCSNADSIEIAIIVSASGMISPLCQPLTLNPSNGGIHKFAFNTIDNITNGATDSYKDYSCAYNTTVTEGQAYDLSIDVGLSNKENVKIWLDKNNDGVFTPNEQFFSKENVSKTLTTSIIISGGAVYNVPLRLRVYSDYAEYAFIDACTNTNYGQIQDYAVVVEQNTLPPVSSFTCGNTNVTVGDTILFQDKSLNVPTGWKWLFQGGTPSESMEQNPTVVYKLSGKYNVSLITSNAYGIDTLENIEYIAASIPVPEGFKASITDKANGVVSMKWSENGNSSFIEDFEDGVADDFIFNDPVFSVQDGMLSSVGLGDDMWGETYINRRFDNFTCEYKFRRDAGENGAAVGLFLRSSGSLDSVNFTGYLLCIATNGAYSMWRLNHADVYNLCPWTGCSALNTGTSDWNVVTANVVNDSIQIYINGQFVQGFSDPTYASGKVGFGNYMSPGSFHDIKWDDVKVVQQNGNSFKLPNAIRSVNEPLTKSSSFKFAPVLKKSNTFVKPLYLLPSISSLKDTSLRFNVYRNNSLLETIADNKYIDTLELPGTYSYYVTQKTSLDESLPSNSQSLTWYGNPVISINPASFVEEVIQGDSVSRELVIKNIGDGVLVYNIQLLDTASNLKAKIKTSVLNNEWLSLSIASDTLYNGESDTILLWLNSKNIIGNRYFSNIQINSTDNLNSVVNIPCTFNVLAVPVAQIAASAVFIPKGQQISFTNQSTGCSTYTKWIFEGGLPDTSYIDNPIVEYDSIGVFDVTLIVSNSLGIDTLVLNDYITVSNVSYCKSNLGGGFCPGDITNVTITNTNLNNNDHSNCSNLDNSIYIGFPAEGLKTATLTKGKSYNLSVTTSNYNIVSVWIDYNQDGIFSATEWNQVVISSIPGNPSTIQIQIPKSSKTGMTGMRIRSRNYGNSNGATDACTQFGSGITEDYWLTIQPDVPSVPIAKFSGPNYAIVGETVTFNDESDGVPNNWNWTFTGGTPDKAILQNPTVIYSTPGVYNVKLVVVNDLGIDSVEIPSFITIGNERLGESCNSAIDLNEQESPYSGSTIGYNSDYSYCNNYAPDMVFYADILPGDSLIIGQSWNNYDSRHTLRQGGNCPGDEEVFCVDDPDVQEHVYVNYSSELQRVYWIQAGYSGQSGDFKLNWRFSHESCAKPKNLIADSIGFYNASVTWEPGSAELSWDLEWGPSGFSHGDGSYISNLNVNSFVLTGLDLGIAYDVYVRSNCSDTETSSWKKLSFTTLNLNPPVNVVAQITDPENGHVAINWNLPNAGVSEDFADGIAQNWVPVLGDWSVSNGTYNAVVGTSMYPTLSSYYNQDFTNYTIEANVRKTSMDAGYMGLFFNGNPDSTNQYGDWTKCYSLYYTGSYWGIFMNDGEYSYGIGSGESTSIVDEPNVWNKLKISVSNGYIECYINDSYIGTFYDATFLTGKVGIRGYTQSSQVEFDDVKITPLSSGYTFRNVNQNETRKVFKNIYEKNPTIISMVGAPVPTKNSFTFNGENAEVYYSIYRNGIKIDTTSNSIYNDILPAFGEFAYQVSTVASSVESNLSNPSQVKWFGNPTITLDASFYNDTLESGNQLHHNLMIKNTGSGKLIVDVEASCDTPFGINWLSVSEIHDTLENNEELVVNVDINASELYSGNYLGNIKISSTDWNQPSINIPVSLSVISLPVADFISDSTNIVKGNYLHFWNVSSGNPDAFLWSFPGGRPSSSTQENPIVYYENAGSFDVSLEVKNTLGSHSITKSNYVLVQIPSYCNYYLGGSTYCPGDISYVGFAGTSLNNFDHDACSDFFNLYSAYTKYLPQTGTTADLSRGSSYELQVVTKAEDIVSVWVDYNQNGEFEASEWSQVGLRSNPNEASKISMRIPDDANIGQTGLRIRTRAAGNSNGANDACAFFGDFTGYTEDYTINIVEAEKPTFAASDTSICAGDTIAFAVTSETEGDYLWNFGEGAIPSTASTVGSHNVVYSSPGMKTVSLTLNGNITTSKEDYIVVNSVPEQYTLSAPEFICSGKTTDIILESSLNNISYALYKDGQDIDQLKSGTGNALVWTGMEFGNYVARGFDGLTGCSSGMLNEIQILEHPVFDTVVYASICPGQNYVLPDNNLVNTIGIYTVNLTTTDGCDSIVTTHLNYNIFESSKIVSLCKGDSIQLTDGRIVSEAGVYTSILVSYFGCDSVVTTNVTENPIFASDIQVTLCYGEKYQLPNGTIVDSTGIFTSNLQSIFGCDSIVRTHLQINPEISSHQNVSICSGKIFTLPDGSQTSVAGHYSSVFNSSTGCDSVVYTTVNISAVTETFIDASICKGGTYILPDGSKVKIPGQYTSLLSTENGCDSIVNTTLSFNPNYIINVVTGICKGDSVSLPDGRTVKVAGVYISKLNSVNGCDSVVYTTVTINPAYVVNESKAICIGSSYTLPNGNIVTETGVYVSLLTSINACDSIVYTSIKVNPIAEVRVNKSICQGEFYQLPDGQTVQLQGEYRSAITATTGCDSTVITNLTVNPVYEVYESRTICEGNSYLLPDGKTVREVGTYSSTLHSITGCDSIIVTTINIIELPTVTAGIGQTICEGATISLLASGNGQMKWVGYETNPIEVSPLNTSLYKAYAFNSCGKDSDEVLISVISLPLEPVISINGKLLESNYTSGNQWYSLNDGMISGATSQQYNPMKKGDFFAIVTRDGCSSDSSNLLNIQDVDIKEQADLSSLVNVYPVPVDRKLNILSKKAINSIIIIDGLGKLVYKKEDVGAIQFDLDMSSYKAGAYDIIVSFEGDENYKVVKQIMKK